MPEGPEIRRAADQVQRAVMLAPIDEVYFAFGHLQVHADRFAGRSVTAVETRGKAMLIHVDNGLSIYSHNQLYGRWFVRQARHLPKTNRQLRLALHNAEKSALLYSASEIAVLTPAGITSHPFLSRLGPDVLSASSAQVLQQLYARRFQRRRLGVLYLDQGFVAGIGNYLRSEILFLAGLDPMRRPCDCDADELRKLAGSTIRVARQSYRHNGVTTDPTLARRLKIQGQTRSAYRHWVFGRAGLPCRQCAAPVVRELVAGRRLYRCSVCQLR